MAVDHIIDLVFDENAPVVSLNELIDIVKKVYVVLDQNQNSYTRPNLNV